MRKIIILIAAFALWNCGSDSELRKSVFIPDSKFPELPQYSEWGYNTFGVYYGRQPFISNDQEVPLNITNHDNVTSFAFKGQLGGSSYSYYSSESPSLLITVSFSDFHPETYEDLMSLHETVFDLTDPQIEITVRGEDDAIHTTEIIEGQFNVKRAQMLFVDEEKQEVILSGVFNFRAVVDGESVSVSEGRFDCGVAATNFFKY